MNSSIQVLAVLLMTPNKINIVCEHAAVRYAHKRLPRRAHTQPTLAKQHHEVQAGSLQTTQLCVVAHMHPQILCNLAGKRTASAPRC